MPPALALILCTIFVIILLSLERKYAHETSFVSWVPTVWLLYSASKPLGVWFGTGGIDVQSGSELDRIFLLTLLCIGIFILILRNFIWTKLIRKNMFPVLLLAYMLVSILWSDIPFVSFKRWTRELIPFVMVLIILSENKPMVAMESLLRRTAYILLPFSVILIKYFPKYGVLYTHWEGAQMWLGVATHKNELGRLCFISIFFLVWAIIRKWNEQKGINAIYRNSVDVLVIFIALWLMKGPGMYSATSVVSLGLGFIIFIGLLWTKKNERNLKSNLLMIIFASLILIGSLLPFWGGSLFGDVTHLFGRNETLTGRNEIWRSIIYYVEQNRIFGLGFGGFWTTETRNALGVSEAHNGYLEVLLELGIIGFVLYVIFLFSCFRKARTALKYDFYWGSLWLCIIFMTVVSNMTESSFNSFTSYLSTIFVFLLILIPESFGQEIIFDQNSPRENSESRRLGLSEQN